MDIQIYVIKIIKQKYDNIGDINNEITYYSKYREELLNILNKNPLITYSEFKKKSSILFRYNDYNFDIKVNTIKNLYYTWKKNNKIFSIFEKLYKHEYAIFMNEFKFIK